VGTLVVVSRGEAFGSAALAALEALPRVVPRVVLVTTGEGGHDPLVAGGIQVLPWLGEDGFSATTPSGAARSVDSSVGARA
jgi:hypothetical protein